MRNLYFVLLALLLGAFLVACGGGGSDLDAIADDVNEAVDGAAEEVEEVVETAEETAGEAVEEAEKVVEEMEESMPEGAFGLPMVDPTAFDGDIAVAGSSTVFPLAERMAERFNDEGFAGAITIDSIGSGGGFERFCEAGESDVSNASRPIKDSEVEQCQAIGRDPIEFRVGTDALAVVVSSENDFLTNASLEELAAIFSTAELWSDVNPDYPAEPILRYVPGTDSGTFDYFVEEVFEEEQEPILSANNLELSEDDNVLVQGVLGSPYAVSFFGYAYYQENADVLNILAIDGVEAVKENVDNNSYPLARPLYMYSTAEIMMEKPQVAAYLNFVVQFVNEEIVEVGYFPAAEADLMMAVDGVKMGLGMMDAHSDDMMEEEMEEEAMEEEAMEEDMMMSENGLPMVDPLSFSGDIAVAGSSTVFPLAERMAERFNDEGFAGAITIDSIGSGGGFERFCEAGESDVSNASRPIKDSEVEQCQSIGRDPIEFRVGTDALAVVVSSENDFLTNASLEELAAIFSTAELWSDVNPDYPAEPILRYIPGTDSGTFDYFVEEVFDEDQEPILGGSNLELSEDDNVLVQGVLGSPYAVSFFGYAYYQENADVLNILAIDGVEAVKENVDNNSYPLARPLYMYSTAEIMQEKPQVAAFLNFVVTYVNEEIVEVGYFPAAEADLQSAIDGVKMGLGMMDDAMMDEEMMDEESMDDGMMMMAIDPLAYTGDIAVAGSSTVFPLAERMAERFNDEGFAGAITIDSIGSGGGFERFCETGESDVSNASRPIKDSEVEACQSIGRDPIEFRVGTDALAVVVSAENDFLTDVTMEELAAIFSTAETWADVNADWPAEPILRYVPGTDSGTFDYFVEEVFDEDQEPILSGNNLELSEDDNVLVQGILGSPYAVGFFGYAYYQENADALNILAIDGIEAVKENVDNNSYPLGRPLYMYSTAEIMQEKPQVGAFIGFVLQFVNEEIVDVGYFPAADADLQGGIDAWMDANQ